MSLGYNWVKKKDVEQDFFFFNKIFNTELFWVFNLLFVFNFQKENVEFPKPTWSQTSHFILKAILRVDRYNYYPL